MKGKSWQRQLAFYSPLNPFIFLWVTSSLSWNTFPSYPARLKEGRMNWKPTGVGGYHRCEGETIWAEMMGAYSFWPGSWTWHLPLACFSKWFECSVLVIFMTGFMMATAAYKWLRFHSHFPSPKLQKQLSPWGFFPKDVTWFKGTDVYFAYNLHMICSLF